MQLVDRLSYVANEIRKGRAFGVGMKKGEVFNIKPNHDNDVDKLKEIAGVGRKVPIDEREESNVEKVKSLNFWDTAALESGNLKFDVQMRKMMDAITACKAPPSPEIKPDSPENSSRLSSDDSEEMSEEAKEYEADFKNGLNYWLRSVEVLFENLNFVANMASNGFRVVQTNTDNTLVLTMPSESLFKGDTQVPYIVLSIQKPGDTHYNFGDTNEKEYELRDGTKIYVTMGRRLDRNRLIGYTRLKNVYETAISSLSFLRRSSSHQQMSPMERLKVLMYISNININTSSILDNARYMAELCMADYSFCHEYIKDKFMVPTKNLLQLHLFSRLISLLKSLNKDMEDVRVRKAVVDSDGNVNMESARITTAKFTSYFFEGVTYQKMECLISEIQCLFFSICKGLHGKFHNKISIHKTPLKLEEEYRKLGRLNPTSMGKVSQREEFNPKVIVLAARRAEDSVLGTRAMIRDRMINSEKVNSNPLSSATTSSTKSVLIPDETRQMMSDNDVTTLFDSPHTKFMEMNELDQFVERISNIEYDTKHSRKHVAKRDIKQFKQRAIRDFGKGDKSREELMEDFLKNKIKFNWESRRFEFRGQQRRDEIKFRADQIMKENGNEKPSFHSRGVVVSEVIREAVKDKDGNFTTIGKYAKEAVMSEDPWKFGVSPKGQRTQADREIYIMELKAKMAIYPIEHFYKQVCSCIIEEKISEPGDQKIISLKSQIENGFRWVGKMQGRQKKGDLPDSMKPSIMHMNIDMTKWSARDNLFKFIYAIISSRFLTLSEKLYMTAVMIKFSEKMLYLDEEIIEKLGSKKGKKVTKDGSEIEDDLFDRMTNGFKDNLIKIVINWLQGVYNFLSSFVHVGIALLYEEYQERKYRNRIRLHINCHSDDGLISIYVFKDESDDTFLNQAWSSLDFFTRQVCIELSIKKSFVSNIIQLFVSQYNIGGEQIYLWIKGMMAAISGCPYDTLKNDISSVLSKVSEALSKGAPKETCSLTIKNMASHLLSVYGLRKQDGTNVMSDILGIPEKYLPTCLGGHHVFDYTTLAIAGPKSVDQMIMMELMKPFGASAVDFTERKTKLLYGRDIEIRALKLFFILDYLTAETPEEEVNDGSFATSLNPLRSIRFKQRRMGRADPFPRFDKDEASLIVKRLKESNPGLGIIKPSDNQDLVNYYFILFKNPNFRAALAGQSPNMLLLHKLANKHKGVFRLKESSNITLSKMKEQEDLTTNMTGKELGGILTKLMEGMDFDTSEAKYLWTKYIKCDPEYKILQFVRENCVKSGAITKPNPFPVRKPNFDEYSEIINQVPKLLCYLFDAQYFKRNNFKINYPEALRNDVEQLVEIFPVEMKKLFSAAKGPDGETRYPHAHKLMKVMTPSERESIALKLRGIQVVTETLEKRFRWQLDEELKKLRASGEIESDLDEMIKESSYKEGEDYDLSDRLLKMSRAFKGQTKKVLFCPPSVSKDFSDIALAMRSQVEGSDRVTVNYSLLFSQNQAARLYRLNMTVLKNSRLREFSTGIANLYSLSVKLGISREELIKLIKSASMFNLKIDDIDRDFAKMPRYMQTRVVVPLSLISPNKAEQYVNVFEPMTIRWVTDEEGPRLSYVAEVDYMNVNVVFKGDRKKIRESHISYSGTLEMTTLNRVFKAFIGDLMEKNRSMGYKYRLYDVYAEMRNRIEGDRPLFGYNQLRDVIVLGKSNQCTHLFKNVTLTKNEGLRGRRRTMGAAVSDDLMILNYDEGGRVVSIRHKDYRTQSLHVLDFDDIKLLGMSLKCITLSPMYRLLMSGDLTKITLDQYIDAIESTGTVTKEIGGYSAAIVMDTFVYLNEESSKAAHGMMKFLNELEEYQQKKRSKRPVLEIDPDLKEAEEVLAIKKARWSEVMEFKRKFDLQYAESAITFIDRSNDLWESMMESGVPLSDMLEPTQNMKDEDKKMISEFNVYPLDLLLSEASPDAITPSEKEIASAILYSMLIMRSKGVARFERDLQNCLKDKNKDRLKLKLKSIEKVVLQVSEIAISTAQQIYIDSEKPEFIEQIHENYNECRAVLGFGVKNLYNLWYTIVKRRREQPDEIKDVFKMFKGTSKKKEARPMVKLVKQDKMIKAAAENVELALEARTSFIKAQELHGLSLKYPSEAESTSPSTVETEAEIQSDVKKLRSTYPGIPLTRESKRILAKRRKERRLFIQSLSNPPIELKFKDLELKSDEDDELDVEWE